MKRIDVRLRKISVSQEIGDCGGARLEHDEKSSFAGVEVGETVS